ncbi:hypothetical protein DF3PB_1700013 [uncultured Defluviicoccus sp.]|uniref:Uncharacterized protein n=1 Tax=metagenome TaxID=256318 RepID=A0A380TA44_9ZZZZ|nr:hypothetical protein DF3PB_1700013 [uncultured Defluviicoccus sp.]
MTAVRWRRTLQEVKIRTVSHRGLGSKLNQVIDNGTDVARVWRWLETVDECA